MEHGMLDLVETRENLQRTDPQPARPPRARPRHRAAERGSLVARLPGGRGRGAGRGSRGARTGATRGRSSSSRATSSDRTRSTTSDSSSTTSSSCTATALFEEDAAIVGGLARLGDAGGDADRPPEGHSTGEMMERNFGMPEPDGYRKGMRLMRYAAKFGMPIVTLVDTAGRLSRASAPRSAASRTRSPRSIMLMSRLPGPGRHGGDRRGRQRRRAGPGRRPTGC